MQPDQSQGQELAPHQHQEEVDGIVMESPRKQRLVIRDHAQVSRRSEKYFTMHFFVCNLLSKQTLVILFSSIVNGGWSSYGSYGSCSVTCGAGTKYRSRSCTSPAPLYGGANCAGSSSQSASCNLGTCGKKHQMTACKMKY